MLQLGDEREAQLRQQIREMETSLRARISKLDNDNQDLRRYPTERELAPGWEYLFVLQVAVLSSAARIRSGRIGRGCCREIRQECRAE